MQSLGWNCVVRTTADQPRPAPERIGQHLTIMVGKPVIRGTRIPVAPIIAHLATNTSLDDLFAACPELSTEDVRAALAFTRDALDEYESRLAHTEGTA